MKKKILILILLLLLVTGCNKANKEETKDPEQTEKSQ